MKLEEEHSHTECRSSLIPVRDALDVIAGKWKLQIIISISKGNKRFRDIEKSIPKITSKVLAKELKDLEQHQLIKRTVSNTSPVLVEYTPTPHSESLEDVIHALHAWGTIHRKKIIGKQE